MDAPLPHRPYPKIPTELVADLGSEWVATEKLHGAQVVVACDGELVKFGKRKAWLDEDERFFGWQLLRVELDAAIRAMHAALSRTRIYVYGELHGGGYPHADVEALPGLSPVQTGIWYTPTLRFAAFDLLVVDGEDERFLAHAELEALAGAAELPVVPLLGRGPRRELVQLPVRYPSRVPEQLGLPPLPNNVAEGFVLKPERELAPGDRPVVKHKIPEFCDDRFDESAAFDHNVHLSMPELLRWAAQMVNAPRLASARSKVGERREAILDEAHLDVWIDLEAIFPRRMQMLSEDEDAELRDGLAELLRIAHDGA